ncbi:PLD nuclease N-terminal domain-containing protein [Agromyces aurantiacus]|uniref:PLD nuclease N-terminal domain-containing protein n=1 Tax=Agromyces aurantiacus TaxID=165814 RepID=A0ABV9R3K1_9MICO|nr:PLD nuclease N-terminal domain-containing protein [Agromyces aurantiacus]MBM7503083.1 hypothetical protein [Agromyces aurantiacus]
MATTQRWSDLSTGRKVGTVVGAVVQLALAATAWTDLARRTADEVNGPKPVWAAVILVNYVGPIAYFLFGRRRHG